MAEPRRPYTMGKAVMRRMGKYMRHTTLTVAEVPSRLHTGEDARLPTDWYTVIGRDDGTDPVEIIEMRFPDAGPGRFVPLVTAEDVMGLRRGHAVRHFATGLTFIVHSDPVPSGDDARVRVHVCLPYLLPYRIASEELLLPCQSACGRWE